MVTGSRDYPVKPFVRFFDFVFVVNKQLLATDIQFFNIPENKISYLPNFSVSEEPAGETVVLKGKKENRIVCLANLRPQKDHLNLLEAFRKVLAVRPDCYLYLVGGGNKDEYERSVLEYMAAHGLATQAVWLGNQTYPAKILRQCSIGVLSSESEGLPLAIIEYGLTGLAVVSTAVGEVPTMLTDRQHALLVPPKEPNELADAVLAILNREAHTPDLASNLEKLIDNRYSSKAVMSQVVAGYKNILKK
jgi:glycosyltransferase involved in cell wall biosynthesis